MNYSDSGPPDPPERRFYCDNCEYEFVAEYTPGSEDLICCPECGHGAELDD